MRTNRWLSLPAIAALLLHGAMAQNDSGNSNGKPVAAEVAAPPVSQIVKDPMSPAIGSGVSSSNMTGAATASSTANHAASSVSGSELTVPPTSPTEKPAGTDSVAGPHGPAPTNGSPDSQPAVKPVVGKSNLPLPDDYVIGEEDSLSITVWKEHDLSNGVVVRPDGIITVPLVGEMRVAGMTPLQLQSALTEKLKPFVTVPQVTVAVNSITSRKVYLIGQAAREGTFQLNTPTTVLQLIAQAGGLRDYAKRKKIYILRKHGAEQTRYSFNYDDVIRGRKIDQNILLAPGDTIVVP